MGAAPAGPAEAVLAWWVATLGAGASVEGEAGRTKFRAMASEGRSTEVDEFGLEKLEDHSRTR